jgi:Mn2+/Fe2+ NRAMP family transporter
MDKLNRDFIRNTLGPGLLLAGAAIGVSHLVQATRAGADYGFALWWALLFACLTKYPFLEFGRRFTSSTGKNLVTGYWEMGKIPFSVFTLITIGTMFIVQAVVTIVTAGLAEQLFGLGIGTFEWCLIVAATCISLLLFGRYPGLDFTMKVIVSLLAVGTLIAVLMAIGAGTADNVIQTPSPEIWNIAGLSFAIAFIGWMPIPLDSAVWHSIWMKEKKWQSGYMPNLRESLWDFNIGYLMACIMGLLFFLLGALIMFGSETPFAEGSLQFSAQFVEMYGNALGSWSEPIISVAAFFAMLSTTLAVTDAFTRVMTRILSIKTPAERKKKVRRKIYNLFLFIITGVALIILYSQTRAFTSFVDLATGLSFLSAPVLAWFNYKIITSDKIPQEARLSGTYKRFSLICLISLILFALIYVVYLLGFLEIFF